MPPDRKGKYLQLSSRRASVKNLWRENWREIDLGDISSIKNGSLSRSGGWVGCLSYYIFIVLWCFTWCDDEVWYDVWYVAQGRSASVVVNFHDDINLQWQIVNRIIRSIIIIIIILLWYYWNIHFMVCLCQMIAAITFIKVYLMLLGRGGRRNVCITLVSTRRWCGPYQHITLWILWLGYSQRYAVARNRGTVSIWISHSEIVIVGYWVSLI